MPDYKLDLFALFPSPVEAHGMELRELRLRVQFVKDRATMNHYSVQLKPVNRVGGTLQWILMGDRHSSGYTVRIATAPRFSRTRLAGYLDRIKPHALEIATLYSLGAHDEIVKLIKQVYA